MDLDEILRIGLRSAIIVTIALAIGFLFFWLARRDRAKAGVRRPRRLESFVTAHSPEAVLRILTQEMGRRTYQIEETVTSDADLLLSEPATDWSWGFFFPIYLIRLENGQTRVEIGVQSKAVQFGPIVRKRHRTCVTAVKAVLGQSGK